ncbi:ZYRO0G05258p [Zygosaccharomyces rouxii]|uniref:ZYRO0G05258p n=1 Tax=Zygosaccharomyces rouxii (strain ATCC 2623 / CBS 732 / NBRC 1130 / NCYC 568 / NRRL Y-229) TaxID=559307 RepID=C5DZK8_ZYGRC|nr:uncharacterized protein ZYRO0G05258g [Zygosaccharomyces rouxii]KAH9202291.1 Asparaginase/glutaminase [Zygosaccharomyces rouxii]CAR29292.1 ZYRO0G05258p [Zygosaccharomyces rouxii]
MKLSVLATALAVCSAVLANPVNPAQDLLHKRVDSASAVGGSAATTADAAAGSASPVSGSMPATATTPAVVSGSGIASSISPSSTGGVGSNTTAPAAAAGSSNTTAPAAAAGSSNTTAPAAAAGSSNTTAPAAAAGSSNTTAPAAGGYSNTTAAAGSSNTTAPAAAAGSSNTTVPAAGYSNTTAAAGSSNTSSVPGKVVVFVTGGTVGLKNSSDVSIITLFNSSQALNITQLYSLAARVNATLGLATTQSVVIVSNEESLEPLGIFTSLLFNTDKPLVIAQNGAVGVPIAKQSSSSARGPLVIGDNKLIYPGVFAPSGDDSSSCAAVGIASDFTNATWFFEYSVPALVSPSSVVKQNYSNFTNYNITNTPVVPIIYDGDYSSQLISSLPSASGFVVVSSGSNSTLSTVRNSSSPIVFAEAGSSLRYVGKEDVPSGTIPAGYLSPIKAQILLSVAAANGVRDQQALSSLFP